MLWHAVLNPLVILLAVLAIVSLATSDIRAATMMTAMIALGVGLKLFQESKADSAAAKLKAMISVTATAIRDGQPQEIAVSQLVPGDIVVLAAGDMIPADVRILVAKDLFVIQSSLTGESFPVEKFEVEKSAGTATPMELTSIAFLGASVESGSATGVVVATGHAHIDGLKREYERLSADGFRVLAIATKDIPPRGIVAGDATPYSKDDERDLILNGYVAFLDPPKETAMAASSNFGNMFSVLGASAFVPFLPMAPIQILANNLLYDISQTAIPTDEVDPEQVEKPRPWDLKQLTRFISRQSAIISASHLCRRCIGCCSRSPWQVTSSSRKRSKRGCCRESGRQRKAGPRGAVTPVRR